MAKNILIGVVAFIVTALCAFSVSWYIQASHIESTIKSTMASMPPDVGTMAIDKIETSGFPVEMRVTLTNPRITLHNEVAMGNFVRHASATTGNSAGVLAPARFAPSTLEMALDGKLVVTINALSSRAHYHSEGVTRVTLTKDNTTVPIVIEPDGAAECSVELAGNIMNLFSQSWDFNRLLDIDQLSEHFRSIQCNAPASIATDKNSGQTLFSQAAGTMYIAAQKQGTHRQVTFNIDMKDNEVYPAGDVAYNLFSEAYTPIGSTPIKHSPSLYGKQSFSMSMDALLPIDSNLAKQNFEIHLHSMAMSNDYYNSKGTADIVSAPQGENEHAIVKLSFASNFTDKQPMFAKQIVAEIVDEITAGDSLGTQPELKELLKKYSKQQLEDAIYLLLPEVSSMGTLTQAIDTEFTGNTTTKEGQIKLGALELSSRDYGISGKGEFSFGGKNAIPGADATISCKNCMALVDTLEGYFTRVESALVSLDPKFQGQVAFSPQYVQMVKQLLSGLGVKAANGVDLEFVIKSSTGDLTINQKTLPEIMTLMAPAQ